MLNLDQEYDLFKKICKYKSIKITAHKTDTDIERLKKKGLPITIKNNHFILTRDIKYLSAEKIRSGINSGINKWIDRLEVIYETGSTNKAILEKKTDNNYTILLAESQTEGSGRREKKWISPLGENIYLSIKFILTNHENIHFLPLVAAVSICKSLENMGINGCQIKWPNDLYLDDKKLGGILVESRYNVHIGHTVIVGIGLNINMNSNKEITQSWTSLFNHTKKIYDRNSIVSAVLPDLLEQFSHISQLDIEQFKSDWTPLDYLIGRKILIIEDDSSYSATSAGISEDGALLVEYFQNKNNCKIKMKKQVYSAEVSVKALHERQD